MEQMLRISHRADSTNVLGPGRRAVIWVHGCCFQCEGCLAERYKSGPYQSFDPLELAQWYLNLPRLDGLTISGGEPMLQAGPLAQTIGSIRKNADIGVIVYTGFLYEDLLKMSQTDSGIRDLLGCIDLLIDGPYIPELDDGRPYVGSSNQRLIPLTDRYWPHLQTYYATDIGRQIEMNITSRKVQMIGVPNREQLAIWKQIKAEGDV